MNMFWTEWIFSKLPFSNEESWKQVSFRVISLVLLWFIGFVIYSLNGKGEVYLTNINFAVNSIVTGSIVLYGSYMIQNTLPSVIKSFKSILKCEDDEFNALYHRITRLSFNFIPCLIIASLFMIAFLGDSITQFNQGQIQLIQIWDILFEFIIYLLSATGIWMGLSIWITIFMISRHPLKVALTITTIERFKGLTMLALWFSLFYFLAISVGVVINFIGTPAVTMFELFFSPLLIFVIIGLVSIFFPFYNIHLTLLRMKKDELTRIEEDYGILLEKLSFMNEDSRNERYEDKSLKLIREILSLQLRERMIRNASDWPIDIGFISKSLTMILIPAIVRVSVELFNRYYL